MQLIIHDYMCDQWTLSLYWVPHIDPWTQTDVTSHSDPSDCFICWGHVRSKASFPAFTGRADEQRECWVNMRPVYGSAGVCLFSVCVASFTRRRTHKGSSVWPAECVCRQVRWTCEDPKQLLSLWGHCGGPRSACRVTGSDWG